jgi:DnaJ like chaperone protein
MGFLGKAVGIGFGFMIGGPIGAIMGGFLGNMFDNAAERGPAGVGLGMRCPHCGNHVKPTMDGHCPACGMDLTNQPLQNNSDRQFVFYVSMASLADKMANADGVVTADEIQAFDTFIRTELRIGSEDRKIIAGLFNQAKNTPDNAAAVARQFKELMGRQPQVLHMMVHLLFRIALADGKFHPAEEQFILQVSQIFGISQLEYEQIKALFIKKNDQAYTILGVSSQASDDEVKAAYKKLVIEYHPDKLMAKGVPEDFIKIANEKMAEINSAYDTISKERGL